MKEFKILEFSDSNFPFTIEKGIHTKPFPPHTHDFIELEIILSGSADHIVEGKVYHIEKGEVLIILPGYIHELQNVNKLELYNFKFDLDKLILLATDIDKLSGFQTLFLFHPINKYLHEYDAHMILHEDKLTQAKTLCDLVFNEWLEQKDGYKWVVKSYFLALITYLSRNFSPNVTNCSHWVYALDKTVSYIHENLQNKITLLTLSSMICLSERQYSRIFKKVYGLSPIEYVINCRLTLACKMMKTTQLSIQQICVTCGFGDKISFNRLFKRHYNITPSEYRKVLT